PPDCCHFKLIPKSRIGLFISLPEDCIEVNTSLLIAVITKIGYLHFLEIELRLLIATIKSLISFISFWYCLDFPNVNSNSSTKMNSLLFVGVNFLYSSFACRTIEENLTNLSFSLSQSNSIPSLDFKNSISPSISTLPRLNFGNSLVMPDFSSPNLGAKTHFEYFSQSLFFSKKSFLLSRETLTICR